MVDAVMAVGMLHFARCCNFPSLHPYQGQELCRILESSNVNIMADDQRDAPNKVQALLEYLHDRELDLEEMAERKRLKLEQCYQLRILIADAEQVIVLAVSVFGR